MSITPAEREIEKASARAQESSLDGLLTGLHNREVFSKEGLLTRIRSGALAIEAPTGMPPRAWTEQEKQSLRDAMRRIVAREAAERAACP